MVLLKLNSSVRNFASQEKYDLCFLVIGEQCGKEHRNFHTGRYFMGFSEAGNGWDLAQGFETLGQYTQKKILAEVFIQNYFFFS